MPRTFTSASSEYIGFAPKAWDAWSGFHFYTLCNRAVLAVAHTVYYAGAGGGALGNVQFSVDSGNDPTLGLNAAATVDVVTTIPVGVVTMGASKATGTATPRADFAASPYIAAWGHSNMTATQTNPATTQQTLEEVGRWNGGSDYWNGDIEWVGIWGQGPQLTGNQSEGFPKIGSRFLAGFLHGCQRFWWFNQYPSDLVGDRSNHGANQIARTGTTHTTTNPLFSGLAGTTFDIVPGVL